MHIMELGFHQDLTEITFTSAPAQRRKVISPLTQHCNSAWFMFRQIGHDGTIFTPLKSFEWDKAVAEVIQVKTN